MLDLEQFKQDYPSAIVDGSVITLSDNDYLELHKQVGTAEPDKVVTFYYRGYNIERATKAAKKGA